MTEPARKPGWWYPWIFVGAMGVTVAVNGALIWFAHASFSGLAVEGAYDRGLDYNRALEGAAAQAKLGWRAEIAFAAPGAIEARLTDRDGRPVDGIEAEVILRRPVEPGPDRRLALVAQGGGVFRADVAPLKPGQWIVRVHAFRGADVFQQETRIVAP